MSQTTTTASLDAMFGMLGIRTAAASCLQSQTIPPAMKTELLHSHLPKLAEAGNIEWNPDTETIRRGPNFEEIAPLLKLMVKHKDELPADWP